MGNDAYVGILTAFVLAVAAHPASAGSLGTGSKAAGATGCVEPTELMRRDHMELLLHQRDRTVHQGVRTPEHSLVECIDCHADKDDGGSFVPVNADGQFCQSCHVSAAVSLDCFECHASVPEMPGSSAADAASPYGLPGAVADVWTGDVSLAVTSHDP